MTMVRFVVLLSFLLASATLARADGIPTDPDIDVSDPACISDCPAGVGLNFIFGADASGGGIVRMTNTSGQNWNSLLVTTNSDPFFVNPSSITCITNAFLNCLVENLQGGMTGMYLSGVLPPPPGSDEDADDAGAHGILNGDAFSINLNDNDSSTGSWGADRDFSASANVPNPVPEPNTLSLLAAGLGALLGGRKFRSALGTRSS
jgi:hypothetical protein